MNIVGIGGGTGLPVLLQGLKQLQEQRADEWGNDSVSTTAIVCVSDDGGSSGRLREAFGIPAVGDLRNCLVALSGGDPALRDIFQQRIHGEAGFPGHPLGNLIVAALSAQSGNLQRAVHCAAEILELRGRVLPSTEVNACLCAEFCDGATARGETRIAARRKRIQRVWLEPQDAAAGVGVIDAILDADAIVLGPGSLHTSILPNLLPAGIASAIARSAALKILVCNLMTQPGETDGYSAADHVRTVQDYVGDSLQICLLNSAPLPKALAARYADAGVHPVVHDVDDVRTRRVTPVSMDLLAGGETEVRHDAMKLARWIVALTRAFQRSRGLLPEEEAECVAVAS